MPLSASRSAIPVKEIAVVRTLSHAHVVDGGSHGIEAIEAMQFLEHKAAFPS
jgi:hypothetical protein